MFEVRLASGRAYRLSQPFYVVGRSAECDITVSGSGVSRRHCELFRDVVSTGEVDQEAWIVRDLNTPNGTFVGGRRIEPEQEVALNDGDSILLNGSEELVFRRSLIHEQETSSLDTMPNQSRALLRIEHAVASSSGQVDRIASEVSELSCRVQAVENKLIANSAADQENERRLRKFAVIVSAGFAFAFGLFLFVAVLQESERREVSSAFVEKVGGAEAIGVGVAALALSLASSVLAPRSNEQQ